MAGRYRRSQPSSGRRSQAVRHGQTRQGQWFAGPPPPNPRGEHFLTDRQVIDQLVRSSGVGPGDLVFDLGAGFGALTGPLAATGAKVIAVEIDPGLAARLRRRFAADQDFLVSVIEADLRGVPLPRRPFYVVANPPFALTTWLSRRLLGDPSLRLAGAELILGWGAAKGLTQGDPGQRNGGQQRSGGQSRSGGQQRSGERSRSGEQSRRGEQAHLDRERVRWAARYEIALARRVPATSFSPPPATAAGHVSIRPRTTTTDRPGA